MADPSSLTPEQRAIIARMRQQHARLYEMPETDFLEVFNRVRDELVDSREKKARFLARIEKGARGGTTPHPSAERPSEAKQMPSTATRQPRYVLTAAEARRTVQLPMALRVAMSYYRITLCAEMVGRAVKTGRTGIVLDVDGDRMAIRLVKPEKATAHIPPSRLRELVAGKSKTAAMICERIAVTLGEAYGITNANDVFLVGLRPTASPYKWELTGPIDLDDVKPYNEKSHEAR